MNVFFFRKHFYINYIVTVINHNHQVNVYPWDAFVLPFSQQAHFTEAIQCLTNSTCHVFHMKIYQWSFSFSHVFLLDAVLLDIYSGCLSVRDSNVSTFQSNILLIFEYTCLDTYMSAIFDNHYSPLIC